MSPALTIYRQGYTHKGRAFCVWSYLDDPDPKRSTLLFAFQAEGETVKGLADRAEAIRKARERIDKRPAEPGEVTPGMEVPQTIQGHPPQQAELALG
jgi:hypothetical protein